MLLLLLPTLDDSLWPCFIDEEAKRRDDPDDSSAFSRMVAAAAEDDMDSSGLPAETLPLVVDTSSSASASMSVS